MLVIFFIFAFLGSVFTQDELHSPNHDDLIRSLTESGKIDSKLLNNLKFNPTKRSNVFVSFKNGDTKPVLNNIASSFGPETSGAEKASAIKSGLGAFSVFSQSSTLSFLSTFGSAFTNSETFWISNQLFIKDASTPLVNAIAGRQSVANIKEEGTVHLIDGRISSGIQLKQSDGDIAWGVKKINAPHAWNNSINGEGIKVCIIDTGTRLTHEALKDNYVGQENHGWYDATFFRGFWPFLKKRKPDPIDDQGHGTHCTGSVLGTKGIGVAPGAQWLSCKALNRMGSGTQSGLLKCMEFALCPTDYNGENADCKKKPHIVSNSWGSNSDEVGKEYEDAIDAWRKADIIPVFAAGNSGDDCSTMGSPGASKNVIAVGATNNEDAIADFSSRGPVTKGGLTKPEISAPGVDIYSAGHRSDNAYATMSGTSMACPHVAGLIALQLQKNPELKYQNILDNMSNNAEKENLLKGTQQCGNKKQGDFPNNHFGNGRIDAPRTLSL